MRQRSAVRKPKPARSVRPESVIVRPVASIEELIRTHQMIASQFPARRSAPAHGLEALKARFSEDRELMLVAERDGRCLGGALALRVKDAVKVDEIALEPEARGAGIGRQLMEAIERQARQLGTRAIYLGGANVENRGFYRRLGFAGRRSLMQKGLPLTPRPAPHPAVAELPARPNLLQLRHQAKDLLRAAKDGSPDAVIGIRTVSDRLNLSAAQLAVAREYGFPSWPKLKLEVDRRRLLNQRDVARLRDLIAGDPALAVTKMERWCDHRTGVRPLSYIAMLRFDSKRLGLPHHLSGIGAVARALIEAGAPVDGDPDDRETPLITAASYGDAEVAQTLIKAGADLEAKSAPNSGGVPSGTALQHAAVFGMTDVVDVLVATGARINSLEDAAAAGDIRDWLKPDTQLEAKVRALVIAADHQRLDVIDQLAASGTPINAVDAQWGRQPLCVAAQHGRVRSVKHLLALGADTNVSDGKGRTPFEYAKGSGHSQLAEMIRAAGKKTER